MHKEHICVAKGSTKTAFETPLLNIQKRQKLQMLQQCKCN